MNGESNRPKASAAERLAETLADRIKRGEYASGMRLPTERAFAAEFQADRSTIRRALASLAERQLIVRETGHRPRVSGRPVGQGRRESDSVLQALAVLSPQTPQYPASPAIQLGALNVLRQRSAPYRLVIFDNNAETRSETFHRERQALEAIRAEGIQGVIIWHQGGIDTVPDLLRFQDSGIPSVLVDRRDPLSLSDYVGIDNVEAAKEAVQHLLDIGHRRIAHLTMAGEIITVRDREQGYVEAMRSHGIDPAPEWIYRMSNPTQIQPPVTRAVEHLLSLAEPPTAIFAMNDILAHELISELEARGLRVPESISVMGFDDMDGYSPRPSPLTTVHQPFERMGQKAMELLLNRLAAPDIAPRVFQHVLLATRLVIRSSCAPAK